MHERTLTLRTALCAAAEHTAHGVKGAHSILCDWRTEARAARGFHFNGL